MLQVEFILLEECISKLENTDRTWRAFEFEGAMRNSLGEMK